MNGKNVRHDLDPTLVKAQVEAKIAKNEQHRIQLTAEAQEMLEKYEQAKLDGTTGLWGKPPEGPGYVGPMIDEWNARERKHYALVRVIELPQVGKRFVLAYGEVPDAEVVSGTGPFESVDMAARWFLNGGR